MCEHQHLNSLLQGKRGCNCCKLRLDTSQSVTGTHVPGVLTAPGRGSRCEQERVSLKDSWNFGYPACESHTFYQYSGSEYPYARTSHAPLPHTVPREVVGPAPVHNQVWFVPLTGLSALGADLARRKRNCTKTKPLAWKLLLENPAVGEQRSRTSTRF